MRILILGATGATGQEILRKALEQGYDVNILARSPEKLPQDLLSRVTVFKGELSDAVTMSASLDGVDAVISALGPGSNHPAGLPLAHGYTLLLELMKTKHVNRLIALSTPSFVDKANDRYAIMSNPASPTMKALILMIKTFARSAYNDILAYSNLIQQSDLQWTLYRVGLLNNTEESEQVRVGYVGDVGMFTSRKDIAKFCLEELQQSAWVHKMPLISSA
ncbi:NAD(P)-binding protein [Syncephalastrum racemosum]|uniref:NAD(P)-binding protein n=1 Tax=Syncephalastrum racemosum TaxID=13706 RepID=A0A1X2HIS8_SYNRA|nr:NAD(P)-binding protein [Syncephalastrum racemosum]